MPGAEFRPVTHLFQVNICPQGDRHRAAVSLQQIGFTSEICYREEVQAIFGHRLSYNSNFGPGVRVWNMGYSENQSSIGQYTAIDATFYGFMNGYEFN